MIRQLRSGQPRLRVLLLTNSVAMGGMEEHVRLIAEHLDRRHFTVSSVAPGDPAVSDSASALRAASDHFCAITVDRRSGPVRAIAEAARLARFVRRKKIDVAHLHSTTYSGLWLATLMCWLSGVRRVYVTEHLAPYVQTPWWRPHERRLFGFATTRVISVSEKNRAQRASRFPSPPQRTAVVTNGVDVDRFDNIPHDQIAAVRRKHALEGDVVVIGTAVRFEPEKGLADLVDAFAMAAEKYPEARLLLVGDGSLRSALEAQVERSGLHAKTSFTGFQPDPRPFLAVMDVFVLPVPAGSASIGLLEAMAIGIPAIITFGTPGEAVEPGVSGWWANPNDPTDLADRISDLIGSADQRREMGRAARSRIVDHFSAAAVARQLEQLYRTNA